MSYSLIVFELLNSSLLIVFLGRDLWDAILCEFTYWFGDTNRSIPCQLHIQWFSKCRCLWHFSCVNFMLRFRCAHIALVSSCFLVVGHWCPEGAFVILHLSGASPSYRPWSRSRDVPRIVRFAAFELRPGGLLFIIALIICYIFKECLILSSLSLKYFTLISVCVCNLSHC